MSSTYNAFLSAISGNATIEDSGDAYGLTSEPLEGVTPIETITPPPITPDTSDTSTLQTTSSIIPGSFVYSGPSTDESNLLNEIANDGATIVGNLNTSNSGAAESSANGAIASSSGAASTAESGILGKAEKLVGGAISGAKSGILGPFEEWLTSSAINIVTVLIGIVLIAGAVWGFSSVRDTVVDTARGAAELAA